MSTPLLAVDGLRKNFGDLRALDDVSLHIPPGGSLGIVGESGSGKTTLARLLLGLDQPDAGTITFDGAPRTRVHRPRKAVRLERARQIQMVFQDPYLSLDPRITVHATLAEVLRLHRTSGAEAARRISSLLDLVGLGTRESAALPRELSGGQRQRVAIARALAARPQLLILDEAVAALDVSVQAQILNLLADIREATRIGYLFISHDLAVVAHITDTVAVMRHGSIVETGPTRQILRTPAHPYTRLLRASVPRPGWDLHDIAAARAALDTPAPPVPSTRRPLTKGPTT
ncbi:ABC transporter ATP-binding protein [Streptomyces sp. NPDC091287]|uniref:ABC transporter ATP-binding protein n=1 Tax=Streptomyces sp. NPDC091287 TaxID=3365988 RepID=UPI0037F81363